MSTSNLSISKCFLSLFLSFSLSLMTSSSCSRTCSLRDSSYPICASTNSNSWEQVCCWSSLMQVFRDSTLYSCFMSSDLASASKWSLFPSRRDFATFAGLESLKKGSLLPKTSWCLKGKSSVGKRFLIQPFSVWKQRDRKVSLYLSDLEMNWTSSFLVQRDKLAIVLHLLLATVGTGWSQQSTKLLIVQVRAPGRCRDAFPQNRRSTLWSVGGRRGVWHVNPRVQWTACLRWNACDPWFSASSLGS